MIPQPPSNRPFVWKTSQDAAQRMADSIALHQTVLGPGEILRGRFIALQLSDGGSDGTAYESRESAIEYNRNNPSRIVAFQIPMERLNAHICDRLLWYCRSAYDNGVREDPRHQIIIPTRIEDLLRDIHGIERGP